MRCGCGRQQSPRGFRLVGMIVQITRPQAAEAYASSFHGALYSRRSHLLASAALEPMNFSSAGSHCSFMPLRRAMLPRWQTLTERWPTSTLQIVGFRLRMQSMKLPPWLVETSRAVLLEGSGSEMSFGSLATISARLTYSHLPSSPSKRTPSLFLNFSCPGALPLTFVHSTGTPLA